jgi:hypothetical protein
MDIDIGEAINNITEAINDIVEAVKNLLETLFDDFAKLVKKLTRGTVYEYQHSAYEQNRAQSEQQAFVNYSLRSETSVEAPQFNARVSLQCQN